MARAVVGDNKPAWELDIEDLEKQKQHINGELDAMLRSDDINVATDEDAHEVLRDKMDAIDKKIKKIREANKKGDGNGKKEEPEPEEEESVEEEPVEFLALDVAEVREGWQEWKRELPKEMYLFTNGFQRQLGGNGTLAHEAETMTELVFQKTDETYRTMQAVKKMCTENKLDKAEKSLAECEQAYKAAQAAMVQVRQLAMDLGVPDLGKLIRGKVDLVYPPVDKLEYDHEKFLKEQAARKELEQMEAAEKALKESAAKFAGLLTGGQEDDGDGEGDDGPAGE